jgi:alpha-D-ribose 1-methylphosphonate 5-triphosphate diphosphatase
LAITNATVILPDRIVQGGGVLVRDGIIEEVTEAGARLDGAAASVVDAAGAYLLPGLVDLHNDGLEFEVNPRPSANLPMDVAFAAMERRLIGAGVTTEFHAISYVEKASADRSASVAAERAEFLAEIQDREDGAIDHQILHRIDLWSPEHLDSVFESVRRMAVGYVSLNDHTPGQGQFRDVDAYIERMRAYNDRRSLAEPKLDAELDSIRARIADRESRRDETIPVLERVRQEAAEHGVIVAGHDDDSPEKVSLLHGLGARISEFPVTIEAARRARELGMPIVVGAPNIVRGGSQSGNLDACELFSLGLADVVCADYHAPSILPSAFIVAAQGLTDLPTAVRTITVNAARAVGLLDRGAIVPGQRADLNLVRTNGRGTPFVVGTFRGGRQVFGFGPEATAIARQTVGV